MAFNSTDAFLGFNRLVHPPIHDHNLLFHVAPLNPHTPVNQFTVRLSIKNVEMSDAGVYYCRANNSIGEDYQDFKVNVAAGRRRDPVGHIGSSTGYGRGDTETCCHEQNVSASCIGACSLSIDLDFLLYRPECFEDFNKLMFCASGASVTVFNHDSNQNKLI